MSDFYQRIINEVDLAHDDEKVSALRRRLKQVPVEDSGPKFEKYQSDLAHRMAVITGAPRRLQGESIYAHRRRLAEYLLRQTAENIKADAAENPWFR